MFRTLPNIGPQVWTRRQRAAFSPLDISGCALWLDATRGLYQERTGASATTPASADGDPVGTWLDYSGNARHATAASDAARPTLKLAIQNSLDVVRFDGTADYLTFSIGADASQTMMFVAKKRTSPGGNQIAFDVKGDGNTGAVYCNSGGSAAGYLYYRNQVNGVVSLGGTAANCNVVVIKYSSTSSADIYINGGTAVNFDPSDGYSTATLVALGGVAAGSFGDFDFSEVLIYDTALSDSNRGLVETYLSSRWGV